MLNFDPILAIIRCREIEIFYILCSSLAMTLNCHVHGTHQSWASVAML